MNILKYLTSQEVEIPEQPNTFEFKKLYIGRESMVHLGRGIIGVAFTLTDESIEHVKNNTDDAVDIKWENSSNGLPKLGSPFLVANEHDFIRCSMIGDFEKVDGDIQHLDGIQCDLLEAGVNAYEWDYVIRTQTSIYGIRRVENV